MPNKFKVTEQNEKQTIKKKDKKLIYKLKELKRLEKLVFADPSDIFNEDTVKESNSIDGQCDDYESKLKPVWEDEEDLNTSIKAAYTNLGRPDIEHPGESTDRYDSLLKRKFKNITGEPKWAKLQETQNETDEQNILQRCGKFIEKNKNLQSGKLNYVQLTDLNKETQREGNVIKAVEFHPSSTVALVAGFTGIVSLFEVNGKTNPKIQMIKFPKFQIYCARFTQDGQQFIVGSKKSKHFYSYDMISGRSILVPIHHNTGITKIENFELSPDGKLMAVCGRFGNIFLVCVKTKEWLGSLKMNGEVLSICFNRDGSKLYSHGEEGQVYIWDMKSRTCVHKFTDDGCLKGTSISISPNEQLLGCGSSSGVVNLYETSSVQNTVFPQPLKILLNLKTSVTSLKFNHSSEILAMVSNKTDKAIRLMHYPSLSVYTNFPNSLKPTGLVDCVSFSPHSGYMACGSNLKTAFLYRLKHFEGY